MENRIKNFLKFNGKVLSFCHIDGIVWIAIKPICEAIGIRYERQFKKLKADKILGQLLYKRTMTGADNKQYLMVSLPEKYIYGWLFSISSDNELLHTFKIRCYEILYEYFHGAVTQRNNILQNIGIIESNIKELDDKFRADAEYNQMLTLKGRQLRLYRQLRELDSDAIQKEIQFS